MEIKMLKAQAWNFQIAQVCWHSMVVPCPTLVWHSASKIVFWCQGQNIWSTMWSTMSCKSWNASATFNLAWKPLLMLEIPTHSQNIWLDFDLTLTKTGVFCHCWFCFMSFNFRAEKKCVFKIKPRLLVHVSYSLSYCSYVEVQVHS